MYTAGGRLYAWGCAEITSPPCRPLVLDHSNSINCQDIEAAVIRRQHPCIAPTLDEVHRIDASAYSVAPREFHKAMHEYSMWLSRQRIEPHSNNNSSINHEQDPSTLACTRWQHAKVQMGPHAIAPTLTDMHSVICGGDEFYVALSKEGIVFTWGDGTFGRLGRTGQPASSTIPHQVIGFEHPIRVVACGARHVVCTDGHGLVYSWGGNLHGQLGTGLTDDVYQPAVIAFLREKVVVDVVAGDDHTMALSDMGDVYTFGNNWCGQLGQGKRDTLWSPVPAPVEFPEALSDPIYMIRSIGTTCAAVSVTGTVFVWGSCAVDLCGLVSRYSPQVVKFEALRCVNSHTKVVDASHIVTSMALSAGCVVLGISTTGTYDQFYADNNTHSPSTNSDETNDAHDNNNGGVAPM